MPNTSQAAVPNSREAVFAQIRDILVEMFEIDPADIHGQAQLNDDLDIDSIDAVDLVVRLRELTGARIAPEQFRDVRTVGDMVDAAYQLMQRPN